MSLTSVIEYLARKSPLLAQKRGRGEIRISGYAGPDLDLSTNLITWPLSIPQAAPDGFLHLLQIGQTLVGSRPEIVGRVQLLAGPDVDRHAMTAPHVAGQLERDVRLGVGSALDSLDPLVAGVLAADDVGRIGGFDAGEEVQLAWFLR